MCGVSKMSRRVDIFLPECACIEEGLETFIPKCHSAFVLSDGVTTVYDFYKLMIIYSTSRVAWISCNKNIISDTSALI